MIILRVQWGPCWWYTYSKGLIEVTLLTKLSPLLQQK